MRQSKLEITRRHAEKVKAEGKRVYSARIHVRVADAIVATAKRQGVTAAALTEKILSDYLQLNA